MLMPVASAVPQVVDSSTATEFVDGSVDYYEILRTTLQANQEFSTRAMVITAPDGDQLTFTPNGVIQPGSGMTTTASWYLDGTPRSGSTQFWTVTGNLHGTPADGTWVINYEQPVGGLCDTNAVPPTCTLSIQGQSIVFYQPVTTTHQFWNWHQGSWTEPAKGLASPDPDDEAAQEDPNNAKFFSETGQEYTAYTLNFVVSCGATPTMSITGAWLGASGTAFSSHIYRDGQFLGTTDLRSVAGATTTTEEDEGATAAGTDTETNIPYNNAAGTSYQFRIRTAAQGEALGVVAYAAPLACTPASPPALISHQNMVFLSVSQAQCANDAVSFSIDVDLTAAVGLNDLDLVIHDAQTGTLLANYDDAQMFNAQAGQIYYMADVFLPGAYMAHSHADVGGVGAVDLFDSVAFNVPVGDCIWHEPDLSGVYLALSLMEGNLTEILANLEEILNTLDIVFDCAANCTINANLTTLQQILENVTQHRDGSIEIMTENFEGYTFGELTILFFFLAMFLWGGYTRQIFIMVAGAIGAVLVTITTPDLPVKWLILAALLAAAAIGIRNNWRQNREDQEKQEAKL